MVMMKKQVRRNESTGGIDTNKFIHILLTIYLKKMNDLFIINQII